MSTSNVERLIYSPQQAAARTSELVKEFKDGTLKEGIKTNISSIDSRMLPFLPGELVTVLAYTSHGKTSWMNYVARQALKDIKENEVVIKCTWEQSVEEDTLYWIANDSGIPITKLVLGVDDTEWDVFMQSYTKRATTPLWIIGHSSIESQKQKRIRPRMTMTNITQACEYIMNQATDSDFKVKLVVLDYLQRIRPDPSDGDTKRLQMMEAVNKAKDLALSLGCPVILGSQGGRDIQERDDKRPRLEDGQETSNIEQSSQKVIGLYYPMKSMKLGDKVEGQTVTRNLMMFTLLKQTLGEAPFTVPLHFVPETNAFSGMVTYATKVI
jgi:replicative DNA helicase